jgi:hypothetical protein
MSRFHGYLWKVSRLSFSVVIACLSKSSMARTTESPDLMSGTMGCSNGSSSLSRVSIWTLQSDQSKSLWFVTVMGIGLARTGTELNVERCPGTSQSAPTSQVTAYCWAPPQLLYSPPQTQTPPRGLSEKRSNSGIVSR